MVMIIIYIPYITWFVTNDAWHAYDVIGVYNIHHEAGRVSYLTELAILWLVGAIVGEVGTGNI